MIRRATAVAVLALCLIGALSPAPASALWEKRLVAAPHQQKHWQSQIRVGRKAVIEAGVFVGTFELDARERGCTIFFDGAGVHARVNVCAHAKHPARPVRVRLRYESRNEKYVPFTLLYGVG